MFLSNDVINGEDETIRSDMFSYLSIFNDKISIEQTGIYSTPLDPSVLGLKNDGSWRTTTLDCVHIFIFIILAIDMTINKIRIPFR